VTGAGGFVGANLVRRLLAEGHDVTALVRGDAWRLEGVQADLVEADLRDAEATGRIVRDRRPEWVFHLAAHGAYSWQTDAAAIYETNVIGTANVLSASVDAGVTAVVQAGSSSEYGFKDHPPSEDELPEPNSDYAVAKVAATMLGVHLARTHGLGVTTLRLYSVYGPWEEPNRLVPTLITLGLEGRLPPLVDPEVARDLVYVDDICTAFVLAAERATSGAVYNVGSGRQITVAEMVDVARSVLGIAEEPQWGTMPNRRWDTGVWVSDPRRIERELGWRAEVPFAEGFQRTVDWLRADAPLRARYTSAVESTDSRTARAT
jgi:dolichol-phosphate mannosyltransferase